VRLLVDLRREAPPAPPGAEVRALDPDLVAAAIRSPRRVRELVRDRTYDALDVRSPAQPLSGRQALVLCVLAASRTHRFVTDGRASGRAQFAARAGVAALRALGREMAGTLAMAAAVVADERRRYRIPVSAHQPRSALYLRVEPSLRWHGSQVGGAATHTSGVVNGLIDAGVQVRTVAAERPAGTERAVSTAVTPRRILDLVQGVGYADYARSIARAARPFDADFVYERYQLGSAAGLRVAQRLGVPLVLEFNGPEVWVERHWRGGRMLLGGPLERLERRNLRDASLVVVVSKALRDIVVAQGVAPERVLVNPNGVDVDALARYREGDAHMWRRRVGLAEAPTVGFVGTFGAWHGVELLPALVAAVPEARWVLIGGGGLLPAVAAEIERRGLGDRTILTGVIDHGRALEMLAASDVCISPHVPNPDGSPFFGSPTKLFEYMGLARPIVASDLDQIGEVIEDGRSGLLCPPGDVESAATAVRRLLADVALRERLGAGALERATTTYSWRAHARRILDALAAGSAAGIGSVAA
jgi:glycosyltransferase involved in cell wall biosynthesis